MTSRMTSLIVLYDMHTDYFLRAIEGIADTDAHNRLNTKANHVAWLAGSMVNERFEMAKLLGVELPSREDPKSEELFAGHKGIQDNSTYPSLLSYKKDWEAISPGLKTALSEITDQKLDESFEMEGMKMTNYEMTTFMAYREANIIGQIILWRRLLGYEPMKYM